MTDVGNMKNARQEKIIELIENRVIETQEELTALLSENGFSVTQATVSRDIRDLKIVKTVTAEGKFKYTQSKKSDENPSLPKSLLAASLDKVDCAGNITVVKTITGMAQGAAAAIDAIHSDRIVGSVAGDDTVIIVMRTPEAALELKEELSALK